MQRVVELRELFWTHLGEISGFFSPCSKLDNSYIFGSGVDIEIKVCGMLTFWGDSTGYEDRILISLSHDLCKQHGKRHWSTCAFGP